MINMCAVFDVFQIYIFTYTKIVQFLLLSFSVEIV